MCRHAPSGGWGSADGMKEKTEDLTSAGELPTEKIPDSLKYN